MIVVDTSVWSRAFRRRPSAPPDPVAGLLSRLIEAHERVVVPGIVLQELLSGVRDPSQGTRLAAAMAPFDVILATHEDHVLAASISNTCRARGVAVTTPDALIAASAARRQALLLTADHDFVRMAECHPFPVRFVPDEVRDPG